MSNCEYRNRNFRDNTYINKVEPCGECEGCIFIQRAINKVKSAYPMSKDKMPSVIYAMPEQASNSAGTYCDEDDGGDKYHHERVVQTLQAENKPMVQPPDFGAGNLNTDWVNHFADDSEILDGASMTELEDALYVLEVHLGLRDDCSSLGYKKEYKVSLMHKLVKAELQRCRINADKANHFADLSKMATLSDAEIALTNIAFVLSEPMQHGDVAKARKWAIDAMNKIKGRKDGT